MGKRRKRRGQKPNSDAPIDRFTWKEGDVRVIYDRSKDPNAKTDEQKRAERRARGEIVESDLRGHPDGERIRAERFARECRENAVRFRARKREQ